MNVQVIEIVISGEAKRSRKQFETDAYFVSAKATVAPGEDIQGALRALQGIVDLALEAAVAGTTPAPVPVPAPRPTFTVILTGPKAAAGTQLRAVGLRFVNGDFIGEFPSQAEAERALASARNLFPSATGRVHTGAAQ